MNALTKSLFSALAIVLTLAGFYPYIRDILRGSIKPHAFSWIIWGLVTLVVFLAQLQADAGKGAWPVGVSAVLSISVAVLSLIRRGDHSITTLDWLFFIAALSSLPLWYITADPLWAVIILTIVDLLGFGPTVRKAYSLPHSESPFFFALIAIRNLTVLLALESYTLTTFLFPAALAVACLLLIAMILYRRRILLAPAV